MNNYIELKHYAKNMKIEPGDIILISSDSRKMIWDALINHKKADLNEFINGLIEAVGPNGTIIFPTYNWDFCNGVTFDIKKSPCKTGKIGQIALEREDFYRTKHPIYSFAVYGKYAKELISMTNKDSFSNDSPFEFFKNHNVKNYIIDVSLKHCFTFTHYVEQQSGNVKYRFIKNFSSGYIDENGINQQRTYSMFVRDYDLEVETTIDPIEPDLISRNAEEIITINSSEIKLLYLQKVYDVILEDILFNKSRKICKYKGQ